ncbi:hypothetical protein [Thalassobellus suaedae]|uniref:YhhN-like protein n=1 Tax=Thalassobellus suaedae TaxID=3074124 RepID=A0ABY9XUU5_9FLAO|nr:hypothetical protein RHP51_02910 [Flavobacteriaceae bacterium HL-DH14]WNH11694.1 hypothetical protein RHP49_12380 [Flavobacteriaceae bacterium HL-DH10]
MYKSRILVGLLVLFYIVFVFFQLKGNLTLAENFDALLVPTITLAYFLFVKRKTLFFSLFLILFSISDLMVLIDDYIPYKIDYFVGNALYILAYVSLFLKICKSISIIHVLKNFKIHLIVLIALSFYIVYVLQVIIDPYVKMTNEYYVELVYNIVMLVTLSASLLNFFYRDNNKSLYLFIGVLCIVFSEVIWVAYTYVAERNLLNIISGTLSLLAFYFFYKQSKLVDEDKKEIVMVIE